MTATSSVNGSPCSSGIGGIGIQLVEDLARCARPSLVGSSNPPCQEAHEGGVRVSDGTSSSASPPARATAPRARMPISSSVSRQSATNAGHSTASRFTPARGELGQTHVGVGLDPGRAAEARLERERVRARREARAPRPARAPSRSTARGSSGGSRRPIASQQPADARQCAPRRVALAHVALGQAVEAEQHVVGAGRRASRGARDSRERLDEAGSS